MGVVQTWVTEISPNFEIPYFGERVDFHRHGVALVVARKGEIHAGAVLACGHEPDCVQHHGVGTGQVEPLCVKRGIRSDNDHVARNSRRPDAFGVVQELDKAQAGIAHTVRDNDGFVLGKIGRGHAVPFVLVLANVG
jgi:hypothetical protein